MKLPLGHPSLDPYAEHFEAASTEFSTDVRVTFLGVSTLLITDGTTSLMTDAFFSRPSMLRVLATRIAPDPSIIDASLARAGVTSLDAIMCAHSHYDHALDAPYVAQQTGAVVMGSESTANICRGSGLNDEQIVVVTPGEPMEFGAFTVTMLPALHSPGAHFEGRIAAPFKAPAKASAWAMGDCFSTFITYNGGSEPKTLLVQASANFIPGALTDQHADTVYLGIAPLGKQDDQFRADLWEHVVEAVGATRVVPVHWDDFFLPLDQPLKPLPHIADDFDRSMNFLIGCSDRSGIPIELPTAWQVTDPFAP